MENIYSQKAGAFFFFCSLFLFSFNALAQVGIGTTDPKTALDVNGALSLREGPVLNLGNDDVDDINLGATPYSFYRITGNNNRDFNITGIAPATGVDGQMVVLVNTRTAGIMTIKHNNSGSMQDNSIYVAGEKDLQLRGRFTAITLQYSKSLKKWVLLNKLNHIETYHDSQNITARSSKLYTTSIPGATPNSSVSVNFSGPVAQASSFYIEYIEVRNNEVAYRIYNSGYAVNNIGVVISINKI